MNSSSITRALVRRIVVANTAAAMLTAAAIEISEPARDFPIVFRVVGALITTLVIVIVLGLIAVARLRRREASLLGWLNENRPATVEERDRMVRAIDERERLHDLFGRHVGEEVARQALTRGVELGGEVREVSVLFVDLVGSTTLVSEHEPAEIVTLLNRFFASVVHHAAAEGGWVNKFEGDAALCIFGAPEEQRDHGARALRAARYLCRALAGIDAGIGISAGSVVAGNVGTKQRYEAPRNPEPGEGLRTKGLNVTVGPLCLGPSRATPRSRDPMVATDLTRARGSLRGRYAEANVGRDAAGVLPARDE